jgi:hypothetical protein
MGKLIKLKTINNDQLEALKIYCFCINSIENAQAMLEQAQMRYEHAREWLEICKQERSTALNLITDNLPEVTSQFEIKGLTDVEKHSKALELINIYLDHPSGEIPTLGEIEKKNNVLIRK